jgi:GDPmannose 4,6-dehydratase
MKTALIIGPDGQDGYYLIKLLESKGYDVVRFEHSLGRPASVLEHYYLNDRIKQIKPDEVYNLSGQKEDRKSFENVNSVCEVICKGTINILEAIREYSPDTRFFNASSSEIYGRYGICADEHDVCTPITPYGCSKLFARNLVCSYRKQYKIHASTGILFNHESPRRDTSYVTRMISRSAAEIKLGLRDKFSLKNIGAIKDWGFAGDYVEAMWMMLQDNVPDDYVISTGVATDVLLFAKYIFKVAGLGDPLSYIEYEDNNPTGIIGNNEKVKEVLGWEPKHTVEDVAKMMYEHDIQELNYEDRSI